MLNALKLEMVRENARKPVWVEFVIFIVRSSGSLSYLDTLSRYVFVQRHSVEQLFWKYSIELLN